MNFRFARRLLPLFAVGAVAAGTLAPAAMADNFGPDDLYGPVAVTNVNSGKMLDSYGGSSSRYVNAIQYHATGWAGLFAATNQQWYVPYTDDTSGTMIKNSRSGLCLTTDGVAGHALYQDYCNHGVMQVWAPNSQWVWSSLSYAIYFKNPTTGLVMDVNQASKSDNAAVVGWYYNGGQNQLWNY